MEQIFAIGDIHGEFKRLESLLESWKPDTQLLIFTGDYVDRGPQSRQVIERVRSLCERYGAIAIGGNHEELFLEWLDNPEDTWFSRWVENESLVNEYDQIRSSGSVAYFSGGGDKTIDSFYDIRCAYRYLPSKHAKHIQEHFPDDVAFLRSLPSYYEWGRYVFVHAGVDLFEKDWKNTKENDFKWIRKIFHFSRNETGKRFVFGHEPTQHLNKNGSNDIWLSPCRTKIGIDGSAVFGGPLHGLVITENQPDTLECYSVDVNLISTSRKWDMGS